MITLRSSKARSEVALICLEVTLTTPRSVYTIFSEGPMTDLGSSFDGALFGAISWPISCFRLADGVLIEQQMFLPHDGSAVALSWTLQGNTGIAAQLVVDPSFANRWSSAQFKIRSGERGGLFFRLKKRALSLPSSR